MLLALESPQGSLHEATIYKTMRQLPLTISILARVWTRQFWYFSPTLPFWCFPQRTALLLHTRGCSPGSSRPFSFLPCLYSLPRGALWLG